MLIFIGVCVIVPYYMRRESVFVFIGECGIVHYYERGRECSFL